MVGIDWIRHQVKTYFNNKGLVMILCKYLSIVLFCGCLFCQPLVTEAADIPDPTEQMKPFIENIRNIINEAASEKKIDITLTQRLVEVSREHFDFHEMSKRVLGRSWRKLSKEEQNEFVELFTQLLQHAYIGKIEGYSGAPIVFKSHRIRGTRAEVRTTLVENNRTINISYIMLLEGERWMVYDIVVEGISLIHNYMEQFRQIVRRNSVEVLKEKIYEKIKELENERKQKGKS